MTAVDGGVEGVGALGPATAFGLDGLEAGAQQAGFTALSGTHNRTFDHLGPLVQRSASSS